MNLIKIQNYFKFKDKLNYFSENVINYYNHLLKFARTPGMCFITYDLLNYCNICLEQ